MSEFKANPRFRTALLLGSLLLLGCAGTRSGASPESKETIESYQIESTTIERVEADAAEGLFELSPLDVREDSGDRVERYRVTFETMDPRPSTKRWSRNTPYFTGGRHESVVRTMILVFRNGTLVERQGEK